MSLNELRRTPASVAERQCDTGSDAGDDGHQRADLVIKAAGIYSMAETREADARRYRTMAVRNGRIMTLRPNTRAPMT